MPSEGGVPGGITSQAGERGGLGVKGRRDLIERMPEAERIR